MKTIAYNLLSKYLYTHKIMLYLELQKDMEVLQRLFIYYQCKIRRKKLYKLFLRNEVKCTNANTF